MRECSAAEIRELRRLENERRKLERTLYDTLTAWQRVQLARHIDRPQTADYVASKDMPLIPVLLPAAALVEILGGLSLLLGLRARIGALVLFVFLIPTTLVFHNFWAHSGMEQMNQMQHFLKNVTIMGGLLMIVGLGSGPLSLDANWRAGLRR